MNDSIVEGTVGLQRKTVKQSKQDICIALYNVCDTRFYKALGLARVNEESHSFTCHPHVCPHIKMSHTTFTPLPQSITAHWPVLISRPTEGRRPSWSWKLGEILRWFVRPKTASHPISPLRPGIELATIVNQLSHGPVPLAGALSSLPRSACSSTARHLSHLLLHPGTLDI